MTQQQMHKLLGVPERTLRDWEKGKRDKLYMLLETLDFENAQKLLSMHNDMDFEKDVLEKLRMITTTAELNEFLFTIVHDNIKKITPEELEKIFDELRLAEKLALFDLNTEANLIRIFTKNWTLEEKKLWCSFLKYLFEQNKIKEPLFVQKLKDNYSIKQLWNEYDLEYNIIDCSFLDKLLTKQTIPTIPSDIESNDIPF